MSIESRAAFLILQTMTVRSMKLGLRNSMEQTVYNSGKNNVYLFGTVV